jgi:alkylhydroperoxidase family enzyme
MRAVAADPTGGSLDAVDRAVMSFASKVAIDASSITSEDAERLRELGLTDADIADLIFAVAARCFFATVLDAAGAEADHQLGATFEADIRDQLTVGRPFASAPSA